MNTNPATFRLRSEILWLLKENASHLIFIDDINLQDLNDQQKLEIVLVDHNCLRSKALNSVVTEIIDHHQANYDYIDLKE